jgi:hypothetical protein
MTVPSTEVGSGMAVCVACQNVYAPLAERHTVMESDTYPVGALTAFTASGRYSSFV